MPGKSVSATDDLFLLVPFNDRGSIESIASFHAPRLQGKQAGEARALIMGVKRFQIYRIHRPKAGDLEFQRLK